MRNEASLAVSVLRELLRYDAEEGQLYWRSRTEKWFTGSSRFPHRACAVWNGRYAGKPALTALSHGYPFGRIFDEGYRAHRVAWAMHFGIWPETNIDHINGDPKDYRIANLRLCNETQNLANSRPRKGKSSRFKGVFWAENISKWRASIQSGGSTRHIGVFLCEETAARAYDAAAVETFGDFAATNQKFNLYEKDAVNP